MKRQSFLLSLGVAALVLCVNSLRASTLNPEIEHRTDAAIGAPLGERTATLPEVLRPMSAQEASDADVVAAPTLNESLTMEASLSTDPGTVVILVATSLPEAPLKALAAQAARLHIALAFSSLPVYARTEEDLRAIESRTGGPHRASKNNGEILPVGPFKVDNAALQALGNLLVPTGVLAGTSPEVWHAVRDALPDEPPVPALVLFGRQAIEVFPGDLTPLELLTLAAERAQYPEIRALAKARLARLADLADLTGLADLEGLAQQQSSAPSQSSRRLAR